MKHLLLLCASLCLFSCGTSGSNGANDEFAPLLRPLDLSLRNSDGGVEVRAAGEPFATVRFDDPAGPCVHPLIGCNGERVTRGFPMDPGPDDSQDHPHHRSLWFAHGDVGGVDFWHKGGTIQTLGYEADLTQPGRVSLLLDLSWRDGDGREVLQETRRYSFGANGRERWIDISHSMRGAGRGVLFGDTKEGTFALRVAPSMRVEGPVAAGTLVNAEGLSGRDVWGKRSPWIAASGPIADGSGQTREITVALFDHPKNLRYPTWWHARTYGLLAANPFGTQAFEGRMQEASGRYYLDAGEVLTLRYRVLIGSRTLTTEELAATSLTFGGPVDGALN